MFKPHFERRKGVILIVVVGLLVLFAGIGITFALLATTERQSARNFKQRFQGEASDSRPDFAKVGRRAVLDVVSQVIYDTPRTNSALRGHSLLRDMYGGPIADPRAPNLARADEPGANGAIPTGPYAMGRTDRLSYRNWWRNAFNGPGIPGPPRTATGDMAFPYPASATPENARIVDALRLPFNSTTTGFTLSPTLWYPLNFTVFRPNANLDPQRPNWGLNPGSAARLDFSNRIPERYQSTTALTQGGSQVQYAPYDEDYDYPDWNNMFLAMERPDGVVIMPSFHRPQLIRELEKRGAFASTIDNAPAPSSGATGAAGPLGTLVGTFPGAAWAHQDGWRVILRPRRLEYAPTGATALHTSTGYRLNPFRNGGTGGTFPSIDPNQYNGWRDLVDLDNSEMFGDIPAELDVDTDGDGINDAIWVDFGAKPVPDGSGGFIKPLVALKIVDLTGRIPLNTAGNMVHHTGGATAPNNRVHGSNLGASPAEINPKHAMIFDAARGNWHKSSEYLALFQGDALRGIRGKYRDNQFPSAGSPPVEGPGRTNVDENRATPGPTFAMNLVDPTLGSRTPPWMSNNLADSLPATSILRSHEIRAYPAGLAEYLWLNQGHPGYRNGRNLISGAVDFYGEYERLGPMPVYPWPTTPATIYPADWLLTNPQPTSLAAIATLTGGTSAAGQRDNIGRGFFLTPGPKPYLITENFPYSYRSQTPLSTAPPFVEALPDNRDVVGYFLNYERFQTDSGRTFPESPFLDEPTEFNPYDEFSTDDRVFTEGDLEWLFRPNDPDSPSLSQHILRLMPSTFDPLGPVPASNYYTAQNAAYARSRMRRMFTTTTWDLITYNAAPAFTQALGVINPAPGFVASAVAPEASNFGATNITAGSVEPPFGFDVAATHPLVFAGQPFATALGGYAGLTPPIPSGLTATTAGARLPLPATDGRYNRHVGRFDGAMPVDGVFPVNRNADYSPAPAPYSPRASASDGSATIAGPNPEFGPGTATGVTAGPPFIVNPIQQLPPALGFGVFHPLAKPNIAVTPNRFDLTQPPYGYTIPNSAAPETPGAVTSFNLYPSEILEGRRYNLNRPLRRYRDRNANITVKPEDPNGDPTNIAAEVDRQIMAAQIYMILRAACHVPDPPTGNLADMDPRIRTLAQLAANIVDFIDPDDVMTRFHFDPLLSDNVWNPPGAMDFSDSYTVIGFELPRLVVNEGTAFYHDDTTLGKRCFVVAELSNPWPTDNVTNMTTGARDETQVGSTLETPTTALASIDSRSLGRTWALQFTIPSIALTRTTDFRSSGAQANVARGLNIRGKNNGMLPSSDDQSFFVVGADFNSYVSPDPVATETWLNNFDKTNDVDFRCEPFGKLSGGSLTAKPDEVRVRLLRLRNPYDNPSVPIDPDPTTAYPPTTPTLTSATVPFNPYVVVDEFSIPSDAISNITPGTMMGFADINTGPLNKRKTWGRAHPWRSNVYRQGDDSDGKATRDQSQDPTSAGHTFGNTVGHVNQWQEQGLQTLNPSNLYLHFLNRPLATPLELLHVRLFDCGLVDVASGKPNFNSLISKATVPQANLRLPALNFTTCFRALSTDPIVQLAPWFRDSFTSSSIPSFKDAAPQDIADLFRFFEFVETPSRFRGAGGNWQAEKLYGVDASATPPNMTDPALSPPNNLVVPTFRTPDHRATRVPGKININSITAEEVFRAVVDSDEANPPKGGGVERFPGIAGIGPGANSQLSATDAAFDAKCPAPSAASELFGSRQFPSFPGGAEGQWIRTIGTDNVFAGTDPNSQVNSELYKRLLQSVAGYDQILGTLDDLPFRSYSQRSIMDTLLRPMVNVADTSGAYGSRRAWYLRDNSSETIGEPGRRDSVGLARLFDPLVKPLDPTTFLALQQTGNPVSATYHAELTDRLRLLAKIGGNVTTRGMTFAGWMTIGWFRVVPGTEDNQVPLIDTEYNSAAGGERVRHRAFFIVDRSLATGYAGPKDIVDEKEEPLLRLFRIIE